MAEQDRQCILQYKYGDMYNRKATNTAARLSLKIFVGPTYNRLFLFIDMYIVADAISLLSYIGIEHFEII